MKKVIFIFGFISIFFFLFIQKGYAAYVSSICSAPVTSQCNNSWDVGDYCNLCVGGYEGTCNCSTDKLRYCCTSWTQKYVSSCTVNYSCTEEDNRACTIRTRTLDGSCYDTSTSCDCCDDCNPTCPSGSSTSPVTAYPVTASCSNGAGCGSNTITCYYQRQDLCTNATISDEWIKSGESTVITSNANTNVNYFFYIFYNRDHLVDGNPQPICTTTYNATWAFAQGQCPVGSYQFQTYHHYDTARIQDTLTVPANTIFIRDSNNGNLYVDNVQVNLYFMVDGQAFSFPDIDCVVYFNHCTPLCTPTCVSPLTSTVTSYGSTTVNCSNVPSACGTESRTCYCSNCTAPNCPTDLSNTNLGYGTSTYRTSCTNTCNYTNYRTCYCRDCVLPIPTGTTLTDTGKQSTLATYQTTSCSRGTGCPLKTDDLYCIRCTPPACAPTYATTPQYSSSGVYLGSTTRSCNNTLASCGTESRTCYCYDCIQSCPSPLSNTAVVTDPNLILDNFRSCSTGCGVPRTEDCFEVPSPQPTETLLMPRTTPPLNGYGFSSVTHTGIPNINPRSGTLNDPVLVTANFADASGAADIEALFVWMRDSSLTSTPTTPLALGSATPQAPSNSSWGFMMRRTSTNTWIPYVPSYGVTPSVWVPAPYNSLTRTFMISGPNRQNMVEVTLTANISATGFTTLTMPFQLKFSGNNIYESVAQTQYRVYLMGLDRFSFTPSDNYTFSVSNYWSTNQLRYRTTYLPSQLYARAWTNTAKLWTIDKGLPSVTFTNNTPLVSGNTLRLDWTATDSKNLYAIIGNIYSTAAADARAITLSTSTTGVLLRATNPFIPLPEDGNVGRLNGDWSFRVAPNMNATSHSGSVNVNIGANRTGTLIFYITVFDDAGNVYSQRRTYNLDDWFVTDGGLAYSAEGTAFVAKETTNSWTGKLPPFAVSGWIESLTNNKADLSSEMWAEDTIQLDNNDLVSSYVINGHGGYGPMDYSTQLKEAYLGKKDTIPGLIEKNFTDYQTTAGALMSTGVLCGPASEYCVLNISGNLIISTNLKCNKKALIFVDGNLTINSPLRNVQTNIMDASPSDGCIFVVGGNMTIAEGVSQSSSTVFAYDVIHGYFFVDGTTTIAHETSKSSTAIYDGVYINGGIHSQGGIILNRYLRLIDRLTYPVVAVDHHPKYGVLGGVFFGSNFNLQKIEVGFKPR